MTLEEIIVEESHNLSFPHGRNLRSIAFHVRKLEDWAKQLENENDTFKKRIKRLEDAGDRMFRMLEHDGFESVGQNMWKQAKEAKP